MKMLRVFTPLAAVLVALLGLLALLGWALHIQTFKTVLPGLTSMKANTAVCFVLAAISLLLQSRTGLAGGQLSRGVARLLGLMIALAGLLTFSEWVLGWDFHIDQLLFQDDPEQAAISVPGRMAFATTVLFMLLGLALTFLDTPTRRGRWPAQYLTLAATGGTLLAFIACFYNVETFHQAGRAISIALHTVIGFLILCAGVFLARPERGMAATWTGETPGGVLARRLLLPAMLVPALAGWLHVYGERAGWYGPGIGASFFAAVLIGLLTMLVWRSAGALNRIEAERRQYLATRGRLAAIVDSSDDAIVSQGLDGRILTWNASAERLFGYREHEVRGRPISLLVPDELREEETAILLGLQGGERLQHLETVRVAKDGRRIQVSLTIWPLKDDAGRVVGASKILRDISEQKQREDMLRESRQQNEFLASVIQRASQAFGVSYPDGRLGLVNPAFEELTGYTARELQAMDWTSALTPPEWREVERQKLEELNRTGQPVRYEKEYIRKDGTRVPIELLVHLVRDAQGRPEYYYSFLTDITLRRQAEEVVRQSERQFRTLADSIPNLAWWANADGYITWYNRRWYEYTGTTPGQMEGWGWQSVHDPQALPAVMERWKTSLATGQPFEMTFPLRGADGVFRSFLTRVIPLKDAEGRVQQWFGTNTDVSARQQNEEEMSSLNARLEQHVAELQAANEQLQAARRAGLSLAEDALEARREAERVNVELRASNAELQGSRSAALNLMEDAVRARTQAERAGAELQEVNRTLKALSDSNHALMRARDEAEYLAEVCKIVVQDCGHAMVWIGLAEHDEGKTVRPVAQAGFEEGYLETLKLTWTDTERGRGPTGTAIRTGKPGMCRNMLTDPEFAPWREQALKRGYASSLVLPLMADGKAFGALTIYSKVPDAFADREVKLLTELAEDLAYGIVALRLREAHARAEEERQRAQDLLERTNRELERRVAERTAEVRAKSLYARSLLEASLDPLVTISHEGKITDVNKASELATGVRRDRLIGSDFSDYFTEPARAEKGYQQVLGKGFVQDYPLTIRHVSGRTTAVLYNATVYHDEDGRVLGVFAAARDVTERNRMERELQESEARYRSLVMATSQIVWTTDPTGQVAVEMPTWQVFTGQTWEQYRGSGWANAVHPEDRERTRQVWSRAVADRSLYETEYRLRRHDGEYREMIARGVPVLGGDRSIREWVGTCTDITDRKEAERRREFTNSLLALFAQKASIAEYLDAVVETIRRWSGCQAMGARIKNQNQEIPYEAWSGFEPRFLELEKCVSLEKDSCFCIRAVSGEVQDQERGLVTPGGSFRCDDAIGFIKELPKAAVTRYRGNCMKFGFASLAIIPVRYREEVVGAIHLADRRPGRFSAVAIEFLESMTPLIGEAVHRFQVEAELARHRDHLQDLVEQRTAEVARANIRLQAEVAHRKSAQEVLQQTAEELKRSNRDLEQFAYVASHDLQEPLRAVGGYVRLLQRRMPEALDAKAKEFVTGAIDGAKRMERLITDLLAYSRVGTRGGTLAPAALGALLSDALDNLQASIKAAHATVTSDPLPRLTVDGTQITQVFQNLVGNALKFRGERAPEVHIGARQETDRWVIYVRDNGIGIESQYFERMFQIFQRLHTRKHYPGTGIGLAICKKIVERHGGVIWVESEPGKGSTFYFSVPATKAAGAEPAQ